MIKKNIIFFSTNPCVWAHSFPEAVFADNLRKLNFNIEYIYPNNVLSDHSIDSDYNENKEIKLCNNCKKDQIRIIKGFNFKYSYLDDYIDKKPLLKINQICGLLKNKKISEIIKYKYEGVPVGRFALYEPILNNKNKKILTFTKKQKEFYLRNIKSCILAISAFQKILNKKKILALTFYNSYYAKHRCINFLAKKYKIKTITIHAGGNTENYLKTLLITSKDLVDHSIMQKNKIWPKIRNIPAIKESIIQTKNHFLSSFSSNYSYSWSSKIKNNFNLRKEFNIKDNKKIILLALSSSDEKKANKIINTPATSLQDFKNVKSLINFMITYASRRRDVFLIIRIHPREYINKRDNHISENYYTLKKFSNKFKKIKNIKFNFPDEKISFYNILPYIDTMVSEGSTANLDSAFLGLPNVLPAADDYIDFPDDISKIAKNKNNFSKLIDKSLDKEINVSIMKKTYRWFSLTHYHSTLKISFLCAPIKSSFFWSFLRYFAKNVLKNLDIVFYKYQNHKNIVNDLKKNLDIKNFNYFRFPKKKYSNIYIEEKLILKNLNSVLKNSQFNFSVKSKLGNFLEQNKH